MEFWAFLAIVFAFGLLWGSFLNVAIYRLPLTDAAGLRTRTPHTLWFLAWPPSFCPHCKTRIKPWHNVPLLSFSLLRGRGKCCGQPIGAAYPLVEASGGVIFLAAVLLTRNWLDAALAIAFLSLLFVNAVIDWRRLVLLDILTYALLWLGLLANVDARFALLPDAVLGAALGYAGLTAFGWAVSRLMGREALGGGDPKLLAALGAWLGWQALPMLLFLAAVLGIGFAVLRRFWRRRHIPFGPALALAGALMLFFGEEMMTLYWRFASPLP